MKDFFAKIKEKFSSLKKKKVSEEKVESSDPVEETDDLAIDDIDIDGPVSSEDKEQKPKPEKGDKPAIDKKKIFKGAALAIVVLSLFFGGVYALYQYVRDFPKVEAAGKKFFSRLKNKKNITPIYMSMTKGFRKKVTDKEFKYSIDGSSYLFENILKIEADENKYVKKGKRFNLQGTILYKDKSKGNFTLIFMKEKIKGKARFLVDGFEVSSKSKEKKIRKLAYKALQEFLKVLSVKSVESFRNFFHKSVGERMGKEANVRYAVMHSKHLEAGYTEHSYLEKDIEVDSNIQVTFKGTSKTKLGSTFEGKITLYYDRSWSVVGFSFKPKAVK
ncbi:MAG: hypothetical protein KC646_12645 [Candidatus Cloacimonetes bacterium]|nr:hypothetical protein [Candidatus Cloacimonadota bacterium]